MVKWAGNKHSEREENRENVKRRYGERHAPCRTTLNKDQTMVSHPNEKTVSAVYIQQETDDGDI